MVFFSIEIETSEPNKFDVYSIHLNIRMPSENHLYLIVICFWNSMRTKRAKNHTFSTEQNSHVVRRVANASGFEVCSKWVPLKIENATNGCDLIEVDRKHVIFPRVNFSKFKFNFHKNKRDFIYTIHTIVSKVVKLHLQSLVVDSQHISGFVFSEMRM